MSTVIFDPQYVKVKYSILMDSEFCSLKSEYLFMRINWMSFKKGCNTVSVQLRTCFP